MSSQVVKGGDLIFPGSWLLDSCPGLALPCTLPRVWRRGTRKFSAASLPHLPVCLIFLAWQHYFWPSHLVDPELMSPQRRRSKLDIPKLLSLAQSQDTLPHIFSFPSASGLFVSVFLIPCQPTADRENGPDTQLLG
jgi:hypothetical protein